MSRKWKDTYSLCKNAQRYNHKSSSAYEHAKRVDEHSHVIRFDPEWLDSSTASGSKFGSNVNRLGFESTPDSTRGEPKGG